MRVTSRAPTRALSRIDRALDVGRLSSRPVRMGVPGSHLPFKLAEAADIATEVTHSDSFRRNGLSDRIY